MIALENKSDEELVADTRMLVAELSQMRQELERRGVEYDLLSYQGGRMDAKNFERVIREKL